jgi:hypothetical protein
MVQRTCQECDKDFRIERYRLKQGEGVYCSRKCYADARINWTADRFWANTARRESGCVEWLGKPTQTGGYGRLRVNGKQTKAHRYAYELTHGPVADEVMVCHTCDNPICVNPEHLFLGDAFANMRDMAAKGRSAGSRRKGEKHPLAKLSDAQADEIVRRYRRRAPGCRSNSRQLAREFNVSASTINDIVNGKRKKMLGSERQTEEQAA